ncbi:MAG: tRNA (adenosine(37)-N6)-dimethylallyltransferase MiaA [Kineosporiaceae bacterium]
MTDAVVAVVGPTATGKSDLAVRLALRLGGEVVNADSMQLYRGMDIGTAKLTPAERRGVPHHVLDVWPVTAEASVADFQARAREAIEQVRARGRRPILAGGSGLYVRAVLDDLRFPGTDPAVRRRLEAEAADRGAAALHQRLARVDPAAAALLDPRNARRVVRALEVAEITGGPFRAALPGPGPYAVAAVQIGLDRDPARLDGAVADRVDRMLASGLVGEVERLAAAGLREGRTASRALGYAQVLAALDAAAAGTGERAALLREARDQTVRRTRRFVRRQRTWFRRDPRVSWFDADDPALDERVLTAVADVPG